MSNIKIQDEVAKSAEMCVIGAILIDEKALANVIQTLKPELFYFDELKAAYQAILELLSEGCVTAQDESRRGARAGKVALRFCSNN